MTPLRFALVSIVGVLLSEGSENRLNMTIPLRCLFHIELCERKLCWYVPHVCIYCKNMKSSLFPLRPPVPHVSGSLNFSCSAWMLLQWVIPQFSDGSLSTSRMEGLSLSKRSHMVAYGRNAVAQTTRWSENPFCLSRRFAEGAVVPVALHVGPWLLNVTKWHKST